MSFSSLWRGRLRRSAAVWILLGLLAAACSTVRPGDVPTVPPAAADRVAPTAFPGADGLLAGFDLSGEVGLRHGDRLLYGITIDAGDGAPPIRRLLRVEVERDPATLDSHWWSIRQREPPLVLCGRPSRPMHLALLLADADGNEVQRSRIERTHDVFFESSFVEGVLAQRRSEALPVAIANLQLLEICNLLGADAILKRLLGQVAKVPWDVSLLWRQELRMHAGFDQATPIAAPAAASATDAPQPVFALPFDLYLNDSLLVRLSAAVAPPRGPTAAVAGIVRLTAQQAKQPGPRLELELLAAARGPRSDFAAHGAAAFLGYSDEGVALAFSPEGRFVAMPGVLGCVELRDLRCADPTVPARLLGAAAGVEALHFLDATRLLVARGPAIELFDCSAVRMGDDAHPLATIPTAPTLQAPCALEPAGSQSVFVGSLGAGVERWSFVGATTAPQRELVVPPKSVQATYGDGRRLEAWGKPRLGWLLGGRGDGQCQVRWTNLAASTTATEVELVATAAVDETRWTRQPDGRWTAAKAPWVGDPVARRQRWDGDAELLPWDEVAVALMLAQLPDRSGHAAVSGLIGITRGKVVTLGNAHGPASNYVHGFAPDGAFYACVGPGHRVLARVPPP
jgi:hypothetical protein